MRPLYFPALPLMAILACSRKRDLKYPISEQYLCLFIVSFLCSRKKRMFDYCIALTFVTLPKTMGSTKNAAHKTAV